MLKVYIWGTGSMAQKYARRGEIREQQLLGYIQTKKEHGEFMGKRVFEPQEILDTEYDYILVCVYYLGGEILAVCKVAGIPLHKVILVDNFAWIDGTPMNRTLTLYKRIHETQDDRILQQNFPYLYGIAKEREEAVSRYMVNTRNGFDQVEKEDWLRREEFCQKFYQEDYCRYRTFELCANEIIKRNVEGDVAELGVFRGYFARLINAYFPRKTLYLFDTFESFDQAEFKKELELGRIPENYREVFKDSNVELVLNSMMYPDKCVIEKGLFPDTAEGLEDLRFAFVSIDVDLENSILEGLRYFYPRLVEGGAIFVHDYNNRFLEGVKIAVAAYEEELGRYLAKLPIADEGGTLVILKG